MPEHSSSLHWRNTGSSVRSYSFVCSSITGTGPLPMTSAPMSAETPLYGVVTKIIRMPCILDTDTTPAPEPNNNPTLVRPRCITGNICWSETNNGDMYRAHAPHASWTTIFIRHLCLLYANTRVKQCPRAHRAPAAKLPGFGSMLLRCNKWLLVNRCRNVCAIA